MTKPINCKKKQYRYQSHFKYWYSFNTIDPVVTIEIGKIIKNIKKIIKKHRQHFGCDYSYKHNAHMLWQTTF